ncbi:hypothetical protein CPB86DRAFT_873465 [Serendipita vermifera]|nr:hypothetical protein CPB86DRAFT_873465 [Serendipita vermifera]
MTATYKPSTVLFSATNRIFAAIWICLVAFTTQLRAARHVVDDMDPDIRYSGPWIIGSECTGCWAAVDPTKVHDGTWYVGKWGNATRFFEYTFKGKSITIYGVIVDWKNIVLFNHTLAGWNVSATLSIDDTPWDSYHHDPEPNPLDPTKPLYIYNVTLLYASGLSDTTHTARVDLIGRSTFLFDYLAYTTSDDASTTEATTTTSKSSTSISSGTTSLSISGSSTFANQTSSTQSTGTQTVPTSQTSTNDMNEIPIGHDENVSSNSGPKSLKTGTIAGIAAGGVCLLLLVLLVAFWRLRHNQHKRKRDSSAITPIPHETTLGWRSRREKERISTSTAELIPGGPNEGPVEAYPMTSYPIHPRKRIARMRDAGAGGEGETGRQNKDDGDDALSPGTSHSNDTMIIQQTTTATGNDPQAPWLRRDSTSSSESLEAVLSRPLAELTQTGPSMARNGEKQPWRRLSIAPQINERNHPRQTVFEHSVGLPPADEMQTDSSSRPPTAPPPYMASSPGEDRRR